MLSRLTILLLMHLVLVCLIPFGQRRVMTSGFQPGALPAIWALISVLFGQAMLLAAYLGMVRGNFVKRILLSGGAIIGAVLVQTLLLAALKQGDGWNEVPPQVGMLLAFVGVLALLMWIASKWMGHIDQIATPESAIGQNYKLQFSVMGGMVLISLVALVLGLLRAGRMTSGLASQPIEFLLLVTLFGINMLTTVWATLSQGRVTWRVVVVFFISAILGLCLASSAGLENLGSWELQIRQAIPMTVITLVPTAIVVASLLWLRGAGYRLVHSPVPAEAPGSSLHT